MFDFLATLFASRGRILRVTAYQFAEPIKSPRKIRTGLGRQVIAVFPLVDVYYQVDEGRISISRVCLSESGTTILGSGVTFNVHDKSGEAFYVDPLSPPALLIQPLLEQRVLEDLSKPRGYLRRTMLTQWRHIFPQEVRLALISALNARMAAEDISQLIGGDSVSGDVAFAYESPQRGVEERVVAVHGVRRDSIEATDRQDGYTKTFRIDRITNARPA